MDARYRLCTILSVVMVAVPACENGIKTATQIQGDKMDQMKEEYGDHLEQMSDNAVLRNMSVADHHFVAHTAELSGTGTAALERITPYLNTYGGTVRYETYLSDTSLVEQRMAHVREYLALTGCDMDRVTVRQSLSGGQSVDARKAIEVKEKGTTKPGAKAGDTGMGMAVPMQQAP